METITIATLIKLFDINIVANNFFGKERRDRILLLFDEFSLSRLFLSAAEIEKKATSEPDIRADKMIRISIIIKATPNWKVNGWNIVKNIFSEIKEGISKLYLLV